MTQGFNVSAGDYPTNTINAMNQDCNTCRHEAKAITELPCNVCKSFHCWQPRVSIDDATPEQWNEAARSVTTTPTANDTQVGGDHYKMHGIQPWDFIASNGIGYFEGNIIKYVSRWRHKGGVQDLEKARHYLDKLIEIEGRK